MAPTGQTQRSYAVGEARAPLIGQTIGENLEDAVRRFPEREALVVVHQGVRLTYAELNAEVDRLARGLLAIGMQKGDRLAIWAPNCLEWVLCQYATAKAGVILVNVNPAYRTTEMRYALQQSGARVLVSAPAFKSSDYRAMVDEVREDLPGLERAVYLGTPEWDALMAGGDAVDEASLRERAATLDFDDPINIQYTSGTTGFPKGATLSHHNILNNAYFVGEGCAFSEQRPGLHPRALLPLLRHGDGEPGLHLARRDDGRAGAGLRARWRCCRPCRTSAAPRSTACPRCSSPSSTTRTSPAST